MVDGRRVAAVLDVTVYEKLEDVEELETLRAYDRAKASEDEVLPLEKAISGLNAAVRRVRCLKPSCAVLRRNLQAFPSVNTSASRSPFLPRLTSRARAGVKSFRGVRVGVFGSVTTGSFTK